jgi:disulfide bond formation protein DsbB
MKNLLIALKKYSPIEFLRYLAIRLPVWAVGGIFAYMMLTSPLFSKQQYGWLGVYTLIVAIYPTYVEIVENIVTKALEDDKA